MATRPVPSRVRKRHGIWRPGTLRWLPYWPRPPPGSGELTWWRTLSGSPERVGPWTAESRYSLANALCRVGRYDQAADSFDQLAETAAIPSEEYRLRRAAGFAAQSAKD